MVKIVDNIKTATMAQITTQALKILPKASDENLIRLISMFEVFMREDIRAKAQELKTQIKNKHTSIQLIRRVGNELCPNCRDKLIKNLMINAIIKGGKIRERIEKEEGWMPPFFLVISPTMRCNLRCVGCYAGEYTQKDDMSIELLDRILNEAKELGMYFVTISGGEPFIRKDILEIFRKHNDMYFQVYTNGQLINEELAKKLAELGNVTPAISVEGFEKETDARRGDGVYHNVLKAMDNLKKYGVMFGFSATPTKLNSDILCSDKFVDFYIKKGCSIGWYFQYIPIGKKPDINLMSTPEQRNRLRERIKEMRKTKVLFFGDFWNDGPYVGGCMAGARRYFHIVSSGDVEPCVFMHFAVDNIKDKSLREAINSPFFKKIRSLQPYCESKNLLTPCGIIDNPYVLRQAVEEHGAKPTHPGSDTIVKDPKIKKHLDDYSKEIHKLTEKVWEKDYKKEKDFWFGEKGQHECVRLKNQK